MILRLWVLGVGDFGEFSADSIRAYWSMSRLIDYFDEHESGCMMERSDMTRIFFPTTMSHVWDYDFEEERTSESYRRRLQH